MAGRGDADVPALDQPDDADDGVELLAARPHGQGLPTGRSRGLQRLPHHVRLVARLCRQLSPRPAQRDRLNSWSIIEIVTQHLSEGDVSVPKPMGNWNFPEPRFTDRTRKDCL